MEREKSLTRWNFGTEMAFSDGCSFNSDAFESALSSMASSSEFFSFPPVMPLRADPGFAERAARFSCFRNINEFRHGLLPGKDEKLESFDIASSSSCKKSENAEFFESREASSISEQVNLRKRKTFKTKKTNDSRSSAAKAEKDESNCKRRKSHQESESKRNVDSEPAQDYIHVRARRGQATDSHSLAERVRREKISERMKLLQDLVPGCNKVTGKAVMLDEIINYVQSLQRQVEFLSMKLASINPLVDTNEHSIGSGCGSTDACFQPDPYPFVHDGSGFGFPYVLQLQQDPSVRFQTSGMLSYPSDGFGAATCQASGYWQGDLSSI